MAKLPPVGYRNPPKATRFKKGRSGNPGGRPKGTRNLTTELDEELKERITIREGGKPRRVSKQRAILKSLIAKALNGDVKGMAVVLTLIARTNDALPEADDNVISDQEREVLARYLPSLLKSMNKGKKP